MYAIEDVKATIEKCAEIVKSKKDALTEIDSMSGDGDLGVSMEIGVLKLQECIAGYSGEEIGMMLMQGGAAFNRAAPSTMGTLIGMGLASVGGSWKGKTQLEDADLVQAARTFADAIARLGKAKRGDKTILDALYPFVDKLEESFKATGNFVQAYDEALVEAKAGLEATKGMMASVGRARWLGERAMQTYDGGATLCVYVLEGLRNN
ncbi:MAG: DAK2 domain-containing protein [bacterium]|nr:DAK2 domain-containing protein [bacterium]